MNEQTTVTVENLIEQICQIAADAVPHSPELAASHKKRILDFIVPKLEHYSSVLGLDKLVILQAWEAYRADQFPVNFYQEYMLPALDGVMIFDTVAAFTEKFPSHKSICPQCKGESSDYYKCTSGKVFKGFTCDWMVRPMLGWSGAYIRILIKESFSAFPAPQLLFKPIELSEPIGEKTEPVIKKLV